MSRQPLPEGAVTWLAQWRSIGGGITISSSGDVCPWRERLERPGTAEEQLVECAGAETLLCMLVIQPELIAAIRVVVGSEAARMAARAAKTMGRKDQ